MPSERPNFIVVTTDQQRYDTYGATGNDIVKTPTFDQLADRGTLFTRAYCQNPVCIPSRACLHTGRYTHQHGVQYMEAEIDTTPPLPPWEKTFMERLQDAGYRTGAVGKIHMMDPKGYHEMELCGGKGARWTKPFGLEIGPGPLGNAYAKWLENKRPGAYMEIYEQRQQPEYKEQRGAVINVLDEDEYVDYWVAQMGIEFMERRNSDQPWFLWVGFCGPHGPCDPPRRYAEMYDIEQMPVPDTWLDPMEGKPEFLQRERPDEMTDEDRTMLQRFYAYYHAEMTFIDDMMKRLLERLEELGFADNTVICTTSDHGEMLGEFGRFGKGNFYEPVTRIPTIWRLPDGNPVDQFDGLTETFQVAPTVLDYAGIEIPPQMAARSLRPVLEGEQTDGQEAVMCEYMDNYRRYAGHCIRTERYKYANWGSDYTGELYDLQEDPGELNNLWNDPEYSDIRQQMADLLMDRQLHTQEPAYESWLHKLPEHAEKPEWGTDRPR